MKVVAFVVMGVILVGIAGFMFSYAACGSPNMQKLCIKNFIEFEE